MWFDRGSLGYIQRSIMLGLLGEIPTRSRGPSKYNSTSILEMLNQGQKGPRAIRCSPAFACAARSENGSDGGAEVSIIHNPACRCVRGITGNSPPTAR